MTHTAALRISEVTEADLGKEFTLNATNFYGVTTYTVTLDNIGGGCISHDSKYRVINQVVDIDKGCSTILLGQ